MNTERILEKLEKTYPDKNIVLAPSEENCTEIIVEVEPTADHPERSLTLAIVGKSEPHYHNKSTEVYEVTKGELTLHIEKEAFILKGGAKKTIKPGQVHYVEGNETWFLTHSTPGWTFKDHILVTP